MTMQEMVGYPSTTRRIESPEGTLWVTVCVGDDYAFVGASAGKSGTTTRAAAQTMGVLAALAIRHGADQGEVALKMLGVTHDRGRNCEATSLADAIGKTLWDTIE